jgi:hypothetical protein
MTINGSPVLGGMAPSGKILCSNQSKDDPSKFLMIETLDSLELHQRSVKDVLPEKLGEIRPLLVTSPRRSCFRLIG